jgi:hypothetical protein
VSVEGGFWVVSGAILGLCWLGHRRGAVATTVQWILALLGEISLPWPLILLGLL